MAVSMFYVGIIPRLPSIGGSSLSFGIPKQKEKNKKTKQLALLLRFRDLETLKKTLKCFAAADSMSRRTPVCLRSGTSAGERRSTGGYTVRKTGRTWKKQEEGVCVCVCPPLDKGFPSTTPIRQGRVALPPYHTQRSCGREWEAGPDQPCVPAVLSSCDSTLPLVCCHGGSMIPPQNLPFAAFILQLSRADRSFSRLDQQLVETPTSLSDFSPCSSVTFLPSVGTEFTEYKCQSVFRSAVPLGC